MKFGALAGLIILIWLYHNSQSSTKEVNAIQEIQPPPVVAAPATSTRAPDPKLVVDVYYECLCPDSKYFVTHHLLPTMEKVGSLMDIKLWPYGKATSQKSDAGLMMMPYKRWMSRSRYTLLIHSLIKKSVSRMCASGVSYYIRVLV